MRIDARSLGQREGFDLRVETHPDNDTVPVASTYSADALLAYQADSWTYVALRVVASKLGLDLGDSWIWGIESGWFPEQEAGPITERFLDPIDPESSGYAREDIEDLVSESLASATSKVAALAKI